MRAVKSQDTGPEWIVRHLLHSMGYRYRLHKNDLAGCPDIIFPARRKVIFVHGCFWHGHDCRRGARLPKTNTDYWLRKIRRNRERDTENQKTLFKADWTVHVIWECELKDVDSLRSRLQDFLGAVPFSE
jgi:DNA mismatch endonuclease (patch repair protein)